MNEILNTATGELIPAGTRTPREIAENTLRLLDQNRRNVWAIGFDLASIRLICADEALSEQYGLEGDNTKHRYNQWVSGIIPDTLDQKTLYNYRRLWEIFGERQPEVAAIPQTGLYELATPQLDEAREDIIGTLLASGPEKVSVKEVQEACAPYISTGSKHVSQKNNDWYTPQEYLAAAREVMGGIDLDPASSDVAQTIVQAKSYHTIDNSGLTVPWAGKVWLNPPYSATEIQEFIKKLLFHWEEGDISEAIVLTNNSTDTAWFHDLLDTVSRVCFTRGRIGFIDISGEQQLQARQGQAFFYLGNKSDEFSTVFSQFGRVLYHDD